MALRVVDKDLSSRFSNMSFLCACLVPLIHLTSFGTSNFDLYSSSWWFYSLVAHGVAMIAVPYFFFASGYFLARHDLNLWFGDEHKNEIKKRCFSLLLPMLIWGLLWWCYRWRCRVSPLDCICLNLTLPLYGPLWFLRSLFIFVSISPLLMRFSRLRILMALLFVSSVLYPLVLRDGDCYKFVRYFVSPLGAFYFMLGMCIKRGSNYNIATSKSSGLMALVVGFCVLLMKCFFPDGGSHVGTVISNCATPFLLYGTWSILPDKKLPAALTGLTMLIYLSHEFVIFFVLVLASRFGLDNTNGFFYVGSAFVVLFITCLCSWAFKTTMPKMSAIMTGGR